MTRLEEALFDRSPLWLAALDANGDCQALSAPWRAALRLGTDVAPALSVADLLQTDDKALLGALRDAASRGSLIDSMPARVLTRSGPIHGALSAWAGSGGNKTTFVAVTFANPLTETALTRLQRKHELILDAAGEGVYGLDSNGRTTFVNRAATEILGWREEDVLGQPLHDIHHHSHRDGTPYPQEACPIYAALRDGAVHRVDTEVFWHSNGTAVPVEYTSTPICEDDGSLCGAVVVFRDISERLSLEQQRQRDYQQIEQLKERLELERDYLRDELRITSPHRGIIGSSEALKRTLAQIDAVAATPVSVLIQGESGVGKEGVARAIHERSDRAERPLVKVNCASIPAELFESEFFGHVQGAFTGAHRDRVGRLQLADGGTLFLDEVGEIPVPLQGKLLRALQEREFERVGDDTTVHVDVRVIAATNRDLVREIEGGRFREDLYYRLSVFPIHVPPLRDRPGDIGPLAQYFLDSICAELRRDSIALTKQQILGLQTQPWPGNVRELKNVIERAAIVTTGRRLRLEFEAAIPAAPSVTRMDPQSEDFVTDTELRDLEKANLLAALRHAHWRISGSGGAAEILDIKPSTLAYRMKVFGISKPRGS